MNMTFGGQFTSRLNMNLREDKGYSYGYRSRFDWRKKRSNFSAGGSVQTAVTKESVIETLKEYEDLHERRPITEEEFEKAKKARSGASPTFETPSPGAAAAGLTSSTSSCRTTHFSSQMERLQAVTLAAMSGVWQLSTSIPTALPSWLWETSR